MKLTSLLFAASFAATAAMFTYCTKEPQTPVAPESATATEVTERGICPISVRANNCTVDVCGSQNNGNLCFSNFAANLFGDDVIPNGVTRNYVLNTPTQMRFSVNPNAPSSLNPSVIVTSGNTVRVFPLPQPTVVGQQVVTIKVGNFCEIYGALRPRGSH